MPGMAAEVLPVLEPLTVGASGRSLGAAGRRRCESDSAWKALVAVTGLGVSATGSAAAGAVGSAAAGVALACLAPVAAAALAASASSSGEGRVRSMRTVSVAVVFWFLSVTSILKLMSVPEGM